MIFVKSRNKWKRSKLSAAEKRVHFDTIREIISLISAEDLAQAQMICKQMHQKVQCSCTLHPISHFLLAHIALKANDPKACVNECWVGFWAPFASFSRRVGADPRRRFFGLGPIRSSVQSRS